MIYLDHAAATPVDPAVLAAMRPYWQDEFYNPSAVYTKARAVRKVLEDARSTTSNLIGTKAGEVYFTAGATESINIAIGGVLRRFPKSNMAVGAIEHTAVWASARGFSESVQEIAAGATGRVTPEAVSAAIDDATVLVSIGYASGEIGTIQPLQQISAVIDKIRQERIAAGNELPLYLHTDASQAASYLHLHVQRLGVDLLTLNGGKVYGPKQSGLLYVRSGVELEPLLYGGGQERGLRGGTENVAFAVGFAKSLELAQSQRRVETKRQAGLQRQLIEGVLAVDGTKLNGPDTDRIAGNVHVSFPDVNGEMLLHHLDTAGIMAATGSACNADSSRPSRVLQAIGCSEAEITGSLRLSLGRATTSPDIETVISTLQTIVPKLRRRQ